MSVDPYKAGMLTKSPYTVKEAVLAKVVAVLDFASDQRGLQLIQQPSRAVKEGEVHELIVTMDKNAAPASKVNQVAYLAFVAINNSGVILRNDQVTCNGNVIGTIAGFDETHMPNHQNIVIFGTSDATGHELGFKIGDIFTFSMDKETKK
jgi:hypothetical protein